VGKGKTKKDKAYNHEQIQKALSVCAPRNRVLTLIYCPILLSWGKRFS
jgi:hypothetical protein